MKPSDLVGRLSGQSSGKEPTFHRWSTGGIACNRHLWNRGWGTIVWLRLDNAQRIGRPCERCFPEGVGL